MGAGQHFRRRCRSQARLGVTRLVTALGSTDLDGQREELSALAGRLGLG